MLAAFVLFFAADTFVAPTEPHASNDPSTSAGAGQLTEQSTPSAQLVSQLTHSLPLLLLFVLIFPPFCCIVSVCVATPASCAFLFSLASFALASIPLVSVPVASSSPHFSFFPSVELEGFSAESA